MHLTLKDDMKTILKPHMIVLVFLDSYIVVSQYFNIRLCICKFLATSY